MRVKIFYDEKQKLIGFKPSIDGYKISYLGRVYRVKCVFLSRIVTGEYFPEWSEKDEMLVFSI